MLVERALYVDDGIRAGFGERRSRALACESYEYFELVSPRLRVDGERHRRDRGVLNALTKHVGLEIRT